MIICLLSIKSAYKSCCIHDERFENYGRIQLRSLYFESYAFFILDTNDFMIIFCVGKFSHPMTSKILLCPWELVTHLKIAWYKRG